MCVEYVEENPLILCNVGMGAKVVQFARLEHDAMSEEERESAAARMPVRAWWCAYE